MRSESGKTVGLSLTTPFNMQIGNLGNAVNGFAAETRVFRFCLVRCRGVRFARFAAPYRFPPGKQVFFVHVERGGLSLTYPA
jgi:hypothetical protein